MAIKVLKPTTPARRAMSVVHAPELAKRARPPRRLRRALKNTGGRGSSGRITTRHRGGGGRRLYRVVDFARDKWEIPGVVKAVEYDPNRSAFLVRVAYADGEQRYHLAWEGAAVGQTIRTSEKGDPATGVRMPLSAVPVGSDVFDVELRPGRGGQIARSAGSAAVLREVSGGMAHLKMPSGEIRLVPAGGLATIGRAGNPDHRAVRIGSAGRKRRMGVRPTVRGKAMNPVDHPHGGGEGGSPIGLTGPKTPWGKPALGVRTRKRRKASDARILSRRP